MGEDTLPIIIFVVVMAAFMIWYFTSMKKKNGQMPKKVLEKYEGKIKAECKVKYFYCFVTEEAFVFQDGHRTWFEFKLDEIGFVSNGKGKAKMSGYSMNMNYLGIYGKDGKELKGEIISCQGHKARSGFFEIDNASDAATLKEFVLANVPGVQEK